jgi:hypothetical protein
VTDTPPTVLDLTVMALMEAGHRPVAEALREAGADEIGYPKIGLLGWLPDVELLALARAAILAHHHAGHDDFANDPSELASFLHRHGSWRHEANRWKVGGLMLTRSRWLHGGLLRTTHAN